MLSCLEKKFGNTRTTDTLLTPDIQEGFISLKLSLKLSVNPVMHLVNLILFLHGYWSLALMRWSLPSLRLFICLLLLASSADSWKLLSLYWRRPALIWYLKIFALSVISHSSLRWRKRLHFSNCSTTVRIMRLFHNFNLCWKFRTISYYVRAKRKNTSRAFGP